MGRRLKRKIGLYCNFFGVPSTKEDWLMLAQAFRELWANSPQLQFATVDGIPCDVYAAREMLRQKLMPINSRDRGHRNYPKNVAAHRERSRDEEVRSRARRRRKARVEVLRQARQLKAQEQALSLA